VVTGTVMVGGGDSPDNYVITVAIKKPDGTVYVPKPSFANPSVPVALTDNDGEGRFTCQFGKGYIDSDVVTVYVYALLKEFTPGEDILARRDAAAYLKAIKDAALDSVEYDRKK